MPTPFTILSIDGGGIRGVIPALVLAEIEHRTGRPIASLFDLVAGTSTGGILALGLVAAAADGRPAYSAAQLVQMYEREGRHIFSRSIWHRIRALENAVDEKYPGHGIETVLAQYFGERRLSEALTNTLVTSYEIELRDPFLFKSHRARTDPSYDFPMRDVARATSAAPTYFEPARLDAPAPADYYALIDGGVYANNPAMCAYVEAKRSLGNPADVLLVSLGTGQLTRRLPYERVRGWGLLEWAQPLLNVVFDGVSDTVDYQLHALLPDGDDARARYYRLQCELEPHNDDLDNAGETNVHELKVTAERMLHASERQIEALCAQLAQHQPLREAIIPPT